MLLEELVGIVNDVALDLHLYLAERCVLCFFLGGYLDPVCERGAADAEYAGRLRSAYLTGEEYRLQSFIGGIFLYAFVIFRHCNLFIFSGLLFGVSSRLSIFDIFRHPFRRKDNRCFAAWLRMVVRLSLFCGCFVSFLCGGCCFEFISLWSKYLKYMEDEKKKDLPDVPAAPSREEEARGILLEVMPGMDAEADIIEVAKAVAEKMKKNEEVNRKLVEAFEKEPRMAQVFLGLLKGEKGAAYNFARLFGKDFADMEEGTPEYEEFMAGENDRLAEVAKAEEAQALLDKNLDESEAVIDRYCEKNRMDAEEFRAKIDALIMPIMDGVISEETCAALDRAINYDKDTKDAYDAGVIEGRNTNINAMRDDRGDGLPKGLGASVKPLEKKRVSNPLIADALNA